MRRVLFEWLIVPPTYVGFIALLIPLGVVWVAFGVMNFIFELYSEVAERIAEWAYQCKRGGPHTQTGPFLAWLKATIEMGLPNSLYDEQTWDRYFERLHGPRNSN